MKPMTFLLLLALTAGRLNAAAGAKGETVTLTLEPERSTVLKEDNREIVFRIELTGRKTSQARSTPLNLSVVLDHSGSMEGAKLEKARQAAAVVVNQMSSEDILSVVIYDNDVNVLIPPAKVRDPEALKQRIHSIESGGSTALYDGVKTGAGQIREFISKDRINRILLLSDGLANVGPSEPSDLAKLGKTLRGEDINVSTVGLGDDYNENLMAALAEAGAGNYYYVKDAEKLPGIFEEELGQIQSIIARNITIIIEIEENIEPLEILGRPEIVFKDRKAIIDLGELYGGRDRSFLTRCRVSKPLAETMKIASVRLAYRDEEAKAVAETTATQAIRFTSDREESDRSVNMEVAKDIAKAHNLAAREKALALADQGKLKEAAQVLRAQAAANAALPSAMKDPMLEQEADAFNKTAAGFEQGDSLDKTSRKQFQYENVQQKEQRGN